MSTINKKEQDPDQSKKCKRVNDENLCLLKEDAIKRHKKFYKINVDQFLVKKKMDNSKCRKTNVTKHDLQMKSDENLFQAEIDRMTYAHENTVPLNLGYIIFDYTKYNMFFKNNPDFEIKESHSQQFIIMSTETNEIAATIYFYNLINSNWSPTLNDINNVFYNWGADLDTLINRPVLKCQINDCNNKIGQYNFELVMNYISYKVCKENNGFSNTELLTLAKFTVIMSFDYHCKQMIIMMKQLFNACTRKALNEDDKTAIIGFAQELYSKYTKDDLQKIIVNLFLPIEGTVMKNMYSYLTFKLYNSFLGENTELNAFPTDIHIWFVQYLVSKDYFKQNPRHLEGIIRLLEHVVVIFDLYQDEDNLCNMYAFLYNFVRPIGKSSELVNILDRWRLGLFHLQVNQKNSLH